MALSFVERRAQTRTLRNVYSWLQPQSRYFDDNSNAMPIEHFEKLCGPIQDTQFNADLAKEIVLNPCLNMAEGLLIEYSIILGYKPTDFILPDGYSFASRMPHGNPGKELDLILSVLKSIIKGNEALSEMSEKLNKLIEEKSILDNNESELPRLYPTLQDRIEKCEEVADEEIHDFIDQIEKDASYQTHLYLFKESRPHFLKGAKHVKFIQNAYSSKSVDNCISKPYFDSVFYVMESIIPRLSNEELETALAESNGHFTKVLMKRRDYISDFKLSSNNPSKNVVMFTARVLLRGPKTACDELAPFLSDTNVACMKLFADMPPPLYKFLLESETPVLLQVLFSMRGRYASNNFVEPMDCLVRPGTFPLHKLLKVMLKDSQSFKPHMAKVLHCHITRSCIEKAAAKEEWEETAQALITALSILCGDDRVDKRLYLNLLDDMKKHSKDKSMHEEWFAKYENSEAVAVYIGLMKKKEEPVKNEEEVKEEKKKEGETKKMTRREREKERERIWKEEKEMEKERERIRKEEKEKEKKKERKDKDKERKKKRQEEKEKEKNKDVEVKVNEKEDKKELKTEVEEEGKNEEVKKEGTSDNEKEVKEEQQVEKEEKEEEIQDGTATTLAEDKEATTLEEYEDLDATAIKKDKETTSDEIHENLEAPAVAEKKDETSDGEYEELDASYVTADKETTSDEETGDTNAPTATEDKDETSSSEYEDLDAATGDEKSDGEYEDIDADHTENKTNIEKISLLSEASTQENSAESDEELEGIDGVTVDKEMDAIEEEKAEDKPEHQSKAAAKEENADTEQEVKDEDGLKEGNVDNDQVSEAEDDDEFELIDSSSDHEEGNVDNAQVSAEAEDEDGYVLIDSLSDSEVEPIVEFPESDVERLAATQSSTNSQDEAYGFTNSISNMDQIGKTE